MTSAEAVSAAEAVSVAGDVMDLGRRAREEGRKRGRSRFPSADGAGDVELARARGAARVWAAGTTRLDVAARLDIGAMRRVAKISVRFIQAFSTGERREAHSRAARGRTVFAAQLAERPDLAVHCARRRWLVMAAAGDPPELVRRRAEADALAAECERLRAARDLLTAHMSRLLPPVDASAAFAGGVDDHEASASSRADEASDSMSLASHAMSMMSHTTATTAVTAKSRGGKSLGGASRRSRRKKKSGRASGAAADAVRLSSRDRRVLASTEVEHLEKQHELERVAEEKKLDALRASLEETNARRAAATKARADFERDVVAASSAALRDSAALRAFANGPQKSHDDSEHSETLPSFVSAERWSKHVENLTTSKRAEKEQLALKTASCRARQKGTEAALRQKERAGERLTAVDHETLLIERNRRLERLESRNAELRRLSGVAARAADALAKRKVELEARSSENQFLKADMAAKRAMLLSFDVLMVAVQAEHRKMAKISKDLHVAGSSGDNPPVGEYVRVKDAAHALEARAQDAERKLDLAKAKRRAADAAAATRRLLGRR